MNLNELYAKISASFWKPEQTAAWAKRIFFERSVHRKTRAGTSSANLPIITNDDGYVDPSFYDLTAIKDDEQPWSSAQTFSRGIRSGVLNIQDDTAVALTPPPPPTSEVDNFGVLLIYPYTGGSAGYWGMARLRCGAGAAASSMLAGANFAVTTGVLTGTTGTDSRLTVSAASDGNAYVENRRGITLRLVYTWL